MFPALLYPSQRQVEAPKPKAAVLSSKGLYICLGRAYLHHLLSDLLHNFPTCYLGPLAFAHRDQAMHKGT